MKIHNQPTGQGAGYLQGVDQLGEGVILFHFPPKILVKKNKNKLLKFAHLSVYNIYIGFKHINQINNSFL
jgi:hypothetical protein